MAEVWRTARVFEPSALFAKARQLVMVLVLRSAVHVRCDRDKVPNSKRFSPRAGVYCECPEIVVFHHTFEVIAQRLAALRESLRDDARK